MSIRDVLKYLYIYILVSIYDEKTPSGRSIRFCHITTVPARPTVVITARLTDSLDTRYKRRGPRRYIVVSSISGLAVGANRCYFVVPNFGWCTRKTKLSYRHIAVSRYYRYLSTTLWSTCDSRCLVFASDFARRFSNMKRFYALYAVVVPITAGESIYRHYNHGLNIHSIYSTYYVNSIHSIFNLCYYPEVAEEAIGLLLHHGSWVVIVLVDIRATVMLYILYYKLLYIL